MKMIFDNNTAKNISTKAHALFQIALKDRANDGQSSYLKQMFTNKYGATYRPSGIYIHSRKYNTEFYTFTNYILCKMPENSIIEQDVKNCFWNLMDDFILNHHKKENFGTSFINAIKGYNYKNHKLAIDNYIISLHGINTFSVGSINIELKRNVLKEIRNIKNKIASKKSTPYRKNLTHALNSTIFFENKKRHSAFKITLNGIFADADAAAQKLVNAFITLYRIYRIYKFNVQPEDFLQGAGISESKPFLFTFSRTRRGLIYTNTNLSLGGFSMPQLYAISPDIVKEINKTDFMAIGNQLLDYSKLQTNTLAFNVFTALDWMARARQSEILAEKYLFNFTAIEALLSDKRKLSSLGLTNNIAGYTAELLNSIISIKDCKRGSLENTNKIYTFMKKLYETRSKIVHNGLTKVNFNEAATSQTFAELIVFSIISNYKEFLNLSQKELWDKLDKTWIFKNNKPTFFLYKIKLLQTKVSILFRKTADYIIKLFHKNNQL
ncbi:MAG: HEPN domain-containing protein [Muribaculaceae bacterium]|nr:HEPN domain-containing protein [Muribaculaceae bacterium]